MRYYDILENESHRSIEPIPKNVNDIATTILDAAFEVHKTLGPGLLESVYKTCLIYELRKKGLLVEKQVKVPIQYKDIYLDGELRLDILVENLVLVEVKSIEKLAPIHEAQVLTYLKLTGHRVGYLINFNAYRLKDGIRRLVL
ncbi:MAG TPA: GxxExxY protein [Methanocella sp.]|uniref:GxxExxY protein n=1 Tax=Methanocella sp. TaxID=2052833 RepID=UPI002C65C568|nr:GxxExxY protein [Methanocella sp.]HTY90988.1 GxxExxY protein [Methanocella sp.]